MDRRSFLIGALSIPPVLSFLSSGAVFAAEVTQTDFLKVSRVLIGRPDLAPDIAQRIETLLAQRIPGYSQKLAALAQVFGPAIQDPAQRNALLKALPADELDFALALAKPWYLGYVGTPSGSILKDDAVFVTYLDAQAYEVVSKDLPRTSYPPGGEGWWQAVPEGVTAPQMPEQVAEWTWQPDGATGVIAAVDPAWRAFGMGQYASVELARAALAGSGVKPTPTRLAGNTAGTATTPKTQP